METKIHQVMPPGIKAKNMAVEHMGNPRQRMPVAGIPAGKCPGHPGPGQTGNDMEIIGDVLGIIKVDELVAGDGPITDQRA